MEAAVLRSLDLALSGNHQRAATGLDLQAFLGNARNLHAQDVAFAVHENVHRRIDASSRRPDVGTERVLEGAAELPLQCEQRIDGIELGRETNESHLKTSWVFARRPCAAGNQGKTAERGVKG